SLLGVGAGYVAVELGQLFARFGTRVTLLERGPALLPRYEPVLGATLLDLLRAEGLDVRLNATARRVRRDGDGIVATVAEGGPAGGAARELRAARLLVAAGRVPNTDGLGLERVGVAVDRPGRVVGGGELRPTAAP